MDVMNPVIALCTQGMEAESRGDIATAVGLFGSAWETATTDYERCIAAHYVARNQPTVAERLTWNQRCLELADLVGDDSIANFYPSLHVNLGRDHEELDDLPAARRHYERAAQLGRGLPDDDYGQMIRDGAQAGLERVSGS